MLTRRARSDNMTARYCKNQNGVSFYMRLSNKFRHNFVKVFCGSPRMNPRRSTVSLAMFWRNSRSIKRQMHENLTSVFFFFCGQCWRESTGFLSCAKFATDAKICHRPTLFLILNLCCVVSGTFGYHYYRPGLTTSFPGIFIFPPFSFSDKAERYENLVTRLLARLGVIVE